LEKRKHLALTGFRIPDRRTYSLVAIPAELLRLIFYLKSTKISLKYVSIYLISSGSVESELQISALLGDAFGGFLQPLTHGLQYLSLCLSASLFTNYLIALCCMHVYCEGLSVALNFKQMKQTMAKIRYFG
jgi:hypothetical protein